MKAIAQVLVALALAISTRAILAANPAPGERDYAITEKEPAPIEIQRGQERLANYLKHLTPKRQALLARTPYVAVQVYQMTSLDSPYIIGALVKNSIEASEYYGGDPQHSVANVPVRFVLLYDWRTSRMVGKTGYLLTDVPRTDTIAFIYDERAVYAGTGK
jgi:hypothetical protein